jgi:MYXO-CTERM domain-containing protein
MQSDGDVTIDASTADSIRYGVLRNGQIELGYAPVPEPGLPLAAVGVAAIFGRRRR